MSNLENKKLSSDLYNPDLAILEKYQAFSKELTRIALLCLGILGFLLERIIFPSSKDNFLNKNLDIFKTSSCLLYFSIILLIVSTACSIFHIYYSTDSLTHIVSMYRKKQDGNEYGYNEERHLRDFDFKLCSRLLFTSCISLILGIVLGVIFYAKFLPA
ncbi:hypothetical protein GCM10023210_23900 [Chryseobacterium ginsengisoli]|uniref:Uncharacterized protein n=1 Tax=Chryseobacterium ginsengisoli TaxID=363853 RepID=A0ABP9M9P0_9FLAO